MDDEKLKRALERTRVAGARSAHGIASDIGASTQEVANRLEKMVSRGELKRKGGDYRKDPHHWD